MNKYGQYCPTARAVEILGDRWTLLIVRDLLFGTRHFNELERGLPGIPRALLAGRLKRLQQAGLLCRQAEPGRRRSEYRLTQAGRDLLPVIESLTRWGARWAFSEPEPDELQPVLLLWWMRDRVLRERLPRRRVVVEFRFRQGRPPCGWLVLSPEDVSVCVTHPGYEVDVLVETDLSIAYQVWMGRCSLADALGRRQVEIGGEPALTEALPTWFALSPAAGMVREALQAARESWRGANDP